MMAMFLSRQRRRRASETVEELVVRGAPEEDVVHVREELESGEGLVEGQLEPSGAVDPPHGKDALGEDAVGRGKGKGFPPLLDDDLPERLGKVQHGKVLGTMQLSDEDLVVDEIHTHGNGCGVEVAEVVDDPELGGALLAHDEGAAQPQRIHELGNETPPVHLGELLLQHLGFFWTVKRKDDTAWNRVGFELNVRFDGRLDATGVRPSVETVLVLGKDSMQTLMLLVGDVGGTRLVRRLEEVVAEAADEGDFGGETRDAGRVASSVPSLEGSWRRDDPTSAG